MALAAEVGSGLMALAPGWGWFSGWGRIPDGGGPWVGLVLGVGSDPGWGWPLGGFGFWGGVLTSWEVGAGPRVVRHGAFGPGSGSIRGRQRGKHRCGLATERWLDAVFNW
jgi:hypothetical protein